MKPLAIDLYCGLGGWTEGLLAEGYDVIGFDIERHQYGEHSYPAQLVIQDVLTLHGSQFKSAAVIVASPPCQKYSYMAMPWSRAKAKAAAIRADATGKELERLNRLFNACFRIQREACEAAGRRVPLIVENVKGAQPWVGRARWSFGSFYLWGDVPALMPMTIKAQKVPGFRFDGSGRSFQSASVNLHSERRATQIQTQQKQWVSEDIAMPGARGIKNTGGTWFGDGSDGRKGVGPRRNPATGDVARGMKRWTNPGEHEGIKHHGSGAIWFDTGPASLPSKSPARKFASAMIAKIPLPLSRHIGMVYRSEQFIA